MNPKKTDSKQMNDDKRWFFLSLFSLFICAKFDRIEIFSIVYIAWYMVSDIDSDIVSCFTSLCVLSISDGYFNRQFQVEPLSYWS